MKLTVERNGKAPRWRRCRKAECKTEVSLRTGTWFEGLKLDFRTAVLFIYSWSNDYCSTKFCSKELGLSTNCSVSWKRLLREVAAESLLSNPLVIGGPNCTVEVDETLYAKSKFHRGRRYPKQWVVFGGVCRETGESFLVPVANRSSRLLEKRLLVNKVLLQGVRAEHELFSLMEEAIARGGPNCTVEVDETLYAKSKFHRGRRYPKQWVVFGGVCRETGESFLVPVANRSSRTLIPLIRQYIRPGTTVMTDCWAGYRSLSREDYTHLRVNHSINFVHPDDPEVHTQTVESLWAQVKRSNKLRCGTRRSELDSYLCEFMWRRRLRPNEDPFDKILSDVARNWPPL
ncbi:hypothetical protein M514_19127 [Trichuris suis]|uniref:ISXO2-like transposase domain-containing protein n=1 Tax=Trichuris suis TaxID=68888 RepID=A0A085NGT8_9BILA|nr:hypothetical protein M514_19127 [Trichuris suis]